MCSPTAAESRAQSQDQQAPHTQIQPHLKAIGSSRTSVAFMDICEKVFLSVDVMLLIMEHLELGQARLAGQVCTTWHRVACLCVHQRELIEHQQVIHAGAALTMEDLPQPAAHRSTAASLILPLEHEKVVLESTGGLHMSWAMGFLLGWTFDTHHIFTVDVHSTCRLCKFSRSSGELAKVSDTLLRYPTGMVLVEFEGETLLYVSDSLHQRIAVFNTNLRLVRTISSPTLELGSVYGLAHHNGVMYAADCPKSVVHTFDPAGRSVAILTRAVRRPRGISVAPPCSKHEGLLLVAEQARVRVLSLAGTVIQLLNFSGARLWGIAFADDFVYVADSENLRLHILRMRGDRRRTI